MPATPEYFGAPSFNDLGVWVGTLMGEAGNQPVKGMAAIMDSAYNRTTDPYFTGRFGPDLTSQFLGRSGPNKEYYQYNAWNAGDAARSASISARDFITSPAFQRDPQAALASLSDPKLAAKYADALTAVRGVMGTGDLRGVAGGAMYYANPKNVDSSQVATHQSLGMNAPGVLTIGDHQFYGRGADGFYPATEANNFDFDGAMKRLNMPSSGLPFTGDLAGAGFGQISGGAGYADPHTGEIYTGSTGGGPGFENTFTPGLQQTTTAGLPFGEPSPAEPPRRPQFENDAFNTPSEDTGRGTKPTLIDDLNARPAYGGVHDPNLGVSPVDVDTTGGVNDPNAYTRRVTEALMKEYMPGEYGRKNQTTPTWTPEPGAEQGWTLSPNKTPDWGVGDPGFSYKPDSSLGQAYPYGKGMDFGLTDIAGNPADMPVQNGAPAFMSYNDQYKARTGQNYYNPYYEAHKNDGLWVDPTPGGQTHTLDDILPNGIPTSGPGYKYGTGMDFGSPDINGGQTMTAEQWKQAFPDQNALLEGANNPNNVGGNTNTTPDWQLGDTGFGGGNIGQQPAYTDPANPTGFSSANVSGGVEPAYFSDMGTSSAPINFAAGNTGGTTSLNLGGGSSPGFGGFGMGSTGTTGGFDPGDMGDATTTGGHTDYMNSARTLDAYTAKQQADAVAQRNATDASIANAYAISNSYNPQYNGQTNFNNNVANLNNPLPYYSYSFL